MVGIRDLLDSFPIKAERIGRKDKIRPPRNVRGLRIE
jgi:hypothetical protein